MSAISLKSITGITSITTPAGVDNQLTLHTNNTTERVKIDVAGNVHINNHLAVAGVSTHSDHIHLLDNKRLRLGSASNGDAVLLHNGSDTILDNQTGNLFFRSASTHLQSLSGEDKIVAEADGVVKLYSNNAEKLSTTPSGVQVTGITTSITGFMFGTDGEMYLYKGAANTATLRITSNGPYAEFKDVSGDVQIGSASGTLRLSAGANEKLRITGSGDFGTGGVTPTTQSGRVFHLHAGAAQQRLHMTNNTTGTSATDGFEIIVEQSANTRIRNFEAGDMAFDTGGSNNEVMRLKSSGAVVIAGTSTYSDGTFGEGKLQFNTKTGNHIGACSVADTNNSITHVLFKNPTGAIASVGTHNSDFIVLTGNQERLRIDSNGDVRIGSGTPAARLDVFKAYNGLGAGNAAARIYGTDAGVAETGIRFVEKGTGDLHNQPDAYLMRGISNNVNKFVFLANGKVLIGSTNHNSVIGSGVGSQLQVEGNSYSTSSLALINNQSATDPAFLVFGKSRAGSSGGATAVQSGDRLGGIRWCGADGSDLHSRAAQVDVYVDGTPGSDDMPGRMVIETTPDGSPTPTNHLILYGSTKEVRNSGYYVAQTSGSGTSSQTASFGATQSGMASNSYNYILSGSNDGGNKCVLFVNGSTRSTDGGTNALTLRNDGGNLNLGNSGTSTYIKGTTYISQSIGNQQTVFRYDNSGGVGAYLSLQNRVTAADTAVGIAFGCDNSDASMTSSDHGNGQIKVRNDGSDGGIMSFNVHTGSNFEAMKIVGNVHNRRNATNNNTTAMQGGVAFSVAGIAIDKSWDNYPGLHVFNETGHSDTNQGQFRFHGWNTSYNSYPQSSGSDFSVNLICDGSGLTSDERRKTGISTITNALNTVSQLRGVKYTQVNRELEPQTHMTMDNGQKLGFIAQEVIPHLPSIVIDSGDHVQPMENGYCDRYMIDYGSVVALLTEAVKELKSKNEALEARIATLESS